MSELKYCDENNTKTYERIWVKDKNLAKATFENQDKSCPHVGMLFGRHKYNANSKGNGWKKWSQTRTQVDAIGTGRSNHSAEEQAGNDAQDLC